MKDKRRIRTILATALMAVAAGACVKDQEPVFEKNASVRMTEALARAKEVLTGAGYGWVIEYFLDESNTTSAYGGYTILVKFDDETVTAWGEMVDDPARSYTSLYKMTSDNGPVLSFDERNYVLHYFATPSGTGLNPYGQTGHYQALGGDFEFLVLKAGPDEVLLKGKRGGVHIRMYPLDRPPAAYLAQVVAVRDDIYISRFVDAESGVVIELDMENRHIRFSRLPDEEGGEETVLFEQPFLYTGDGIKMQVPFDDIEADADIPEALLPFFQGMEGEQGLVWHSPQRTLTWRTTVFQGELPDGWLPYEEYPGDYVLVFNNTRTVDVTIRPDVYRKSLILSGINRNYELTLLYDLPSGVLYLMGQPVGTYGDNTVFFAPWALGAGGSLWFSTAYGMKTSLDLDSYEADPEHFRLDWVPGPSVAGRPVDSFILWTVTAAGSSGGAFNQSDWYFPGADYRMAYLQSITKK